MVNLLCLLIKHFIRSGYPLTWSFVHLLFLSPWWPICLFCQTRPNYRIRPRLDVWEWFVVHNAFYIFHYKHCLLQQTLILFSIIKICSLLHLIIKKYWGHSFIYGLLLSTVSFNILLILMLYLQDQNILIIFFLDVFAFM